MAISGGQQRLDWYAVPGVPLTIVLDTADGTDWASAPIVHVGPIEADGDITPVIPAQTATITGNASRATLTLTDAQMAAILTAYPVAARTACPWHVRLGTGESELAVSTGHLAWDTTGRLVTTSAQLVVGPPGPTAVSADPGNVAALGTDGLIYVAQGAGTVSSVNGQTGAVVLGAADVSADVAGAAAAAVAAHEGAADPHPQYATPAEASAAAPVQSVAGRTGAVTLTSSDIGGFTEAAQDAIAAMLVSGANVTLSYDDAANSLAVTASGGDAELMRDTIGTALVGISGITVAVNDAANTITLSIANAAITASMLAAGVIPTWSTISGKPAVVAAGADAAEARAAIGAAASDAPGLLGRYVGVNAQTGTTYAPVLTDEGKLIILTNAAAITLTLPSDATTAFPIGASFDVVASGAGMVTVVAGAGATVNGTPSLVTRAQWSTVTCIKRAADTWLVVGDLA